MHVCQRLPLDIYVISEEMIIIIKFLVFNPSLISAKSICSSKCFPRWVGWKVSGSCTSWLFVFCQWNKFQYLNEEKTNKISYCNMEGKNWKVILTNLSSLSH